jgi:predicted small lipoprotein YifL
LIFGKLRSGPSRRSKLVVAGLVAAAACMQKGPVHMAPGGVLAPEGARGALPDDSKFRVVFSGPAGKAASASEVTIVFNRPLRALERDVPPPSVRMTPALAGNFIWVGSRAIRFVPAGPSTLPGATRVEVEVPETTRALDGSTLGAPHRFAFETPRPRLVSFSPTGGGQLPKATVDLYFNLPIEQAELEKQLVLEANRSGKTQRLAYRVERPDEKSPKRLRIVPKVPLPLDSSIEGVISENLRSPVGPLDASEEQAFSFSTYGPLRVTEATCWMPRKRASSDRRRTSRFRIRSAGTSSSAPSASRRTSSSTGNRGRATRSPRTISSYQLASSPVARTRCASPAISSIATGKGSAPRFRGRFASPITRHRWKLA